MDIESGPTSLHALRERDPQGFAQEVDEIRRALTEYLDFRSLRHASREIGMSASGLAKFVNGAEPHTTTIRKLRTWRAAHPEIGLKL